MRDIFPAPNQRLQRGLSCFDGRRNFLLQGATNVFILSRQLHPNNFLGHESVAIAVGLKNQL
ncbi:MAG TPA: hypothetical protein V6C90_04330 [Coleofasciculaceae cyanobacterium]